MKPRINKGTKNPGDSYEGRVDLKFSLGRCEFVAEAKFVWSGFNRNEDRADEKIRKRLALARSEVEVCPTVSGQTKLGIVFAMPYFEKTHNKSQVTDRIQRWTEVIAGLKASGYAWVFPGCTRTLTSPDKKYYCPGGALIIQKVSG